MTNQSFPIPRDPRKGRSVAAPRDRNELPEPGLYEAAQRFERRAESIAILLERQLKAAASFHDLSKQQLRASHRSVQELSRGGAVPSPHEFWEQTAQPQAGNLFDAVRSAIDSEAEELSKALQQYATAVRLEIRGNAGILDSEWSIDALCRVADRGIRRVAVTVRVLNEIDQLGKWWQDRLRRKAMLSVASKLLTSPLQQFELIVTTAEMHLLEQPPWSHDDRLLSAFELTHSDLREYAMELEEQLQLRVRNMLDLVAREDLIDGSATGLGSTESGSRPSGSQPFGSRPAGADPWPASEILAEPSHTIELR